MHSTLINQVQGAGISTLQQKKNWLIDWYFSNDPMGSTYLATLRNSALVSTYQTNPGMLYGTPFATGMENYFQKIKNYFGQSMFDQLVTEFAQQSNLYVDEIKVDEFHLYGSNRLGVYEANKTISRRVARDLNNDNQISNNEYIVETPEEVLYLYSSYQLERGAKRYELANHLGNVLTVISDKKNANFTGTTFTHFTAERISATDYSPFGAPLAGRTWNGGEFRFGFNSMEKDNEINGNGNAYDFGARIYDARLGRWMSVDPLFSLSPFSSPFRSFSNCPVSFIDPDGKREYLTAIIKRNDGTSTMVRILVSKKVMSDLVKHEVSGYNPASLVYDYEVRYYDFETVVTFQERSDGSFVQVGEISEPRIIKDVNFDDEEDVRSREYGDYFDFKTRFKTDVNDLEGEGGYQDGGVMFATKHGGASPSKWKTKEDKDVQENDIEDVLIAFGGLRGPNVPKLLEELATTELLSTLKDIKEANDSRIHNKELYKCKGCSLVTSDTTEAQENRGEQDKHLGFEKIRGKTNE